MAVETKSLLAKHPLLDELVAETALMFWQKNNEASYTLWANTKRSTPAEKQQGLQDALYVIRKMQSENLLPNDREMEAIAMIFLTPKLINRADLTKQLQIYVNNWKPLI